MVTGHVTNQVVSCMHVLTTTTRFVALFGTGCLDTVRPWSVRPGRERKKKTDHLLGNTRLCFDVSSVYIRTCYWLSRQQQQERGKKRGRWSSGETVIKIGPAENYAVSWVSRRRCDPHPLPGHQQVFSISLSGFIDAQAPTFYVLGNTYRFKEESWVDERASVDE